MRRRSGLIRPEPACDTSGRRRTQLGEDTIAVDLRDIEVSSPEPERPAVPKISYQPGIDGLRAVALLAIFVVHADMGLASGAFLAVSTFFTLSGFLITSLLVIEHGNHDRIDLRSFWVRRARRLLPASLVAIVVIGLATIVLGDANQVTNLPGDVVAALAYVANWHYIVEGTTYGARFGGESPLLHFWSLAIEEQFYVVFPLICAAGLALGRRVRSGFALVLAGGVAISLAAGVIGSLGNPDVDRLYFGTDVRSAELLVGALVAVWWVPRRDRLPDLFHRGVRFAGVGLIVLMLGLIAIARSDDLFWYRGGLVLYALVTAAVVLAAVEPGGPVRRVLSSRPLVAIGVVSYGAYLFHWPIFVWLRSETGLSGGQRLVVGTVAALALAVLSHRLIEEPVRTGRRYGARLLVPAGVALACLAVVVGVSAPRLSSADDEVTLDEALAEFDEHIEVRAAPEGQAPNIGAFGDSTGLVSGLSMALWDNTHDDIRAVRGSAMLGCSIMSPATVYDGDGTTYRTPAHCDNWQADWATAAANGEIDIAFVQFGPWEVYDMDPDGPTERGIIGDAQIDALVEQNLTASIESLLPHTRVVAIATSPHVEVDRLNGQSPDSPAPESDPDRMDRLNEIILEVAARYPQVAVVDLAGWVDDLPDDAAMRPDGVHFDGEAAQMFVEQLSTTLARLAPIDGVDPPDGPALPLLQEPEDVPATRPTPG